MRSVRRPGDFAGHHVDDRVRHLAACPGTRSTLPKKMASVPAASCLARQGWLKKTTSRRAGVVVAPSTSTTARPLRARAGVDRLAPSPGRRPRRPTAEVRHVGLSGAVDVTGAGRWVDEVEHRRDVRGRPAPRPASSRADPCAPSLPHGISSRRVRNYAPRVRLPRARSGAGSLDTDEERIQRLTAVVHLHGPRRGDFGPATASTTPGLAHAVPLPFDERSELVDRRFAGVFRQPTGRFGHRPRPTTSTRPSRDRPIQSPVWRSARPRSPWRRAPPG